MKLKENGLPDFQTALKGDSRDKRCIEDTSKVTESLGEGGREGRDMLTPEIVKVVEDATHYFSSFAEVIERTFVLS